MALTGDHAIRMDGTFVVGAAVQVAEGDGGIQVAVGDTGPLHRTGDSDRIIAAGRTAGGAGLVRKLDEGGEGFVPKPTEEDDICLKVEAGEVVCFGAWVAMVDEVRGDERRVGSRPICGTSGFGRSGL